MFRFMRTINRPSSSSVIVESSFLEESSNCSEPRLPSKTPTNLSFKASSGERKDAWFDANRELIFKRIKAMLNQETTTFGVLLVMVTWNGIFNDIMKTVPTGNLLLKDPNKGKTYLTRFQRGQVFKLEKKCDLDKLLGLIQLRFGEKAKSKFMEFYRTKVLVHTKQS